MAEATRTRMTAAEFAELPETNRPMELINGELIVSPSPKHTHQRLAFKIALLLERVTTSGEVVISPSDVYIDDDNVVEPDVFWVSGLDSRCQLGEDDYWHGAPDLVVEVLSPGTARRDRREKKDLYEKYGTREYWLFEPYTDLVDVWRLNDAGQFEHAGIYGPEDTFTSPVLGDAEITLAPLFARADG